MSTSVLIDGEQLTVRPIRPADTEALIVMHRGLSAETVRSRFFAAVPELPLLQADRFTHVDGVQRVALVVEDESGHLVAVGRYDRLPPDGSQAEVAFVVTDRFQHHGLGTMLVRLLADRARDDGVADFVADVLTSNTAMHHAFFDAGLKARATYDSGVSHLVLPLSRDDDQ